MFKNKLIAITFNIQVKLTDYKGMEENDEQSVWSLFTYHKMMSFFTSSDSEVHWNTAAIVPWRSNMKNAILQN